MAGLAGAAVLAGGGAAVAAPLDPPPEVLTVSPDRGPAAGGHTVTVTGTGFVVGDTAVTFDDVFIEADVQSTTTLTFVAPPHPAGPVTLRVRAVELMSVGGHEYVFESPTPTSVPTWAATPAPSSVEGGEVVRHDDPTQAPRARRPERPTVIREHPRPQAPTLAATGAPVALQAAVGLLALVVGAGLIVLGGGRPRRRSQG